MLIHTIGTNGKRCISRFTIRYWTIGKLNLISGTKKISSLNQQREGRFGLSIGTIGMVQIVKAVVDL